MVFLAGDRRQSCQAHSSISGRGREDNRTTFHALVFTRDALKRLSIKSCILIDSSKVSSLIHRSRMRRKRKSSSRSRSMAARTISLVTLIQTSRMPFTNHYRTIKRSVFAMASFLLRGLWGGESTLPTAIVVAVKARKILGGRWHGWRGNDVARRNIPGSTISLQNLNPAIPYRKCWRSFPPRGKET